MTWKFLAEIETSNDWKLTPLTAGQLFRIKSITNSLKPEYLRAAFVQVVDEEGSFTFFEARRIGFKQEVEAFLFVLPESLPARKLAIKRLDDSDKTWTIQIEELVGEINLPIYPSDITGLSEALASKANASHTHAISDIADFPKIPALWYPERFAHWHSDSVVVNGGAINNAISANQQFNLLNYQNPSSSSDSFKLRAFLASGSYILKILGTQDTTSGMLSISVNGQLLSESLDWYQSRLTHNVVKSVGISFPNDGWQELVFSVNGKNAASTGYKVALTKFDLFKV